MAPLLFQLLSNKGARRIPPEGLGIASEGGSMATFMSVYWRSPPDLFQQSQPEPLQSTRMSGLVRIVAKSFNRLIINGLDDSQRTMHAPRTPTGIGVTRGGADLAKCSDITVVTPEYSTSLSSLW